MTHNWHDRNERFFGRDGQEKLRRTTVAVVGIGGLGTHVVQQLALLGVGRLILVDPEELDDSNRNRYVGARHDDPVPGTLKVEIGQRLVHDINPEIEVSIVPKDLISQPAFDGILRADYVFGCLDNEGGRLILTELTAAYEKPYFDLASEILIDESRYGGRVVVAWDGSGCIVCLGELDVAEAQADLMNPQQRRDRNAIYGLPHEGHGEPGPSVVSINGVVASLGVSEFMLVATGVRALPRRVVTYHGHEGGARVGTSPPAPDCYYCVAVRGRGNDAAMERYL